MRVIIVGAEDTGKRKLAEKVATLAADYTVQLPPGYSTPGLAVGLLSDYRMELHLAIERMWDSRVRKNTIYTHSLLDSFAYSAYKLFLAVDYDSYSQETLQKWEWTSNIIGSMLKDSFLFDEIYRLPGYKDAMGKEIDRGLDEILEVYGFPVTELSGDLDKDAEEIGGNLAGRNNQESEG